MIRINHRPYFDPKVIEEHYSKKDNVPVKYVCTSALGSEEYAMDIFYRDTPHPEFGNRYFGIFTRKFLGLSITNADKIEEAEFDMVEQDSMLHYSRHRHDYLNLGSIAIDGGRTYTRLGGPNVNVKLHKLKVKDGMFVSDGIILDD